MHLTINKRFEDKRRVTAAEDDFGYDEFDDDTDGLMDAVDDVADNLEEIQDAIDEVDEDDVDIATNNNITNHYIAECDRCHGVFISAVIESDQEIDHVSGICPLCQKETDQYLKWVIRDANNGADEDEELEEEEYEGNADFQKEDLNE